MRWTDPKHHTCDRRDWLPNNKQLLQEAVTDFCRKVFMVAKQLLGHSSLVSPEVSLGEHESPRRRKPLPSPPNVGDSWLTPTETAFTRLTNILPYNQEFASVIVMQVLISKKTLTSRRHSRRGSKLVLASHSLMDSCCTRRNRNPSWLRITVFSSMKKDFFFST